MSLYNQHLPIDVITLNNNIANKGEYLDGNPIFDLMEMIEQTPSAANAVQYAYIVKEKYVKRQLIEISGRLQESAWDYNSDALEDLGAAETIIRDLSEGLHSKTSYEPIKLAKRVIEQTEAIKAGKFIGLDSGICDLDQITGGFHAGDMITIAARTSIGKTSLALSIAYEIGIRKSEPLGFISIEMPAEQIIYKLLGLELQDSIYSRIRKGTLSDEDVIRVKRFMNKYTTKRFIIDDTARMDIHEFKSKARLMAARYGIKILFVDYIQLIKAHEARSQEHEVALASSVCKEIAKELHIPVVALAQLNRETDKNGEPEISQIRWSGAIEQDSDIIIMIERPSFYKNETFADGKTLAFGKAKLHVKKNRVGMTGDCIVHYRDAYQKFEEINYADRYGLPQEPGYVGKLEFDNSPGF
jgi:replicative DNA helicase